MPELEITYKPIVDLIPYARNSRTHSEAQVAQIAGSIREFGFANPVLIDGSNGIIAGHGRILAAQKLNMEQVPCVVLDHLTKAQQRALVIADNKLALNAGWDNEMLSLELGELKGVIDLELLGFDADELAALMNVQTVEGLTDEDEVPEVPDEPITKLGDIWNLGNHRLMCGDSTSIDAVERLMDGQKADMVFTDPPYGIKRDKGFGGFGGFGEPIARRRYEDNDWDSDIPPKECFDLMLRITSKAIIFGGNFFAHLLPQGKHWIVWDKKNTMPTFGDAELAWTNIKRDSVKIKEFQYNGLLGKEKERFHPTQKPVALIEEILNDYADKDDVVLDPFVGSGTTIIAAEMTGRRCYAMELSPAYVDVAVTRWENFTGKKAHIEPNA